VLLLVISYQLIYFSALAATFCHWCWKFQVHSTSSTHQWTWGKKL